MRLATDTVRISSAVYGVRDHAFGFSAATAANPLHSSEMKRW